MASLAFTASIAIGQAVGRASVGAAVAAIFAALIADRGRLTAELLVLLASAATVIGALGRASGMAAGRFVLVLLVALDVVGGGRDSVQLLTLMLLGACWTRALNLGINAVLRVWGLLLPSPCCRFRRCRLQAG